MHVRGLTKNMNCSNFTAARSVHLAFQSDDVAAFYNEVVVEKTTTCSYFMVCGWHKGYFGIQELKSPHEKIVLFSVWDQPKGQDSGRVIVENPGVDIEVDRFGGEGTGAKLWGSFPWVVGDRIKCLVKAQQQGNLIAYTAWIQHHRQADWWQLGTLKVCNDGTLLRGLYSFVEDFHRNGLSVHETRKAVFSNAWVQDKKYSWHPLHRAEFTASGAEWESKDNIDAGICHTGFYLSTGGRICSSCSLGGTLSLDAQIHKLPHLPPSF